MIPSIILYLITIHMQVNEVKSCPEKCSCQNSTNGTLVDCGTRGLTSIPTDLPIEMYKL